MKTADRLFSLLWANPGQRAATMTLQDQWTLQKEKGLAWLRVGFAIVAVIVIQLNPTRIAGFPVLSYLSFGSFLIYSLVVLYITTRERTFSKAFGFITTALDLVWVSLIVFSSGGTATPFFVYYFFPMITASSRYGVKGGLSAAVAGTATYGFIRFYFDWQDFLGIDRFVVRSIYLFVLAYVFGFLSEFETKQNQRLLALSKTAGDVATLEERRRISQELHDGLLQSLATLILRLEACRKQFLRSPKDLGRELQSIEEETRSSMKTIRRFLAGQDTQAFPPGMFLEKLKDDLRFLRDGLGLRVILETDPEDLPIPDQIEQDLYYVLREGLMNVTRHSQASRTEVLLKRAGKVMEGNLTDNGVGFDMTQTTNGQGLGLSTMKQRIKKHGGELRVESSPGKGTRIYFILPLQHDQEYSHA
jgi:signal transduction histidine kinase